MNNTRNILIAGLLIVPLLGSLGACSGPAGSSGPPGAPGATGAPGYTGATGAPGAPGYVAEPAAIVHQDAYGRTYYDDRDGRHY